MSRRSEARTEADRKFLVGLSRAFGGAVFFSLPLLMTMEMWHLGFYLDGYMVRLSVANHGTESAADLVIEGELSTSDGDRETSTVTLSYVPGAAERTAGLYFRRDPRTGTLRIRPVGYTAP